MMMMMLVIMLWYIFNVTTYEFVDELGLLKTPLYLNFF